MPEPEKTRLGGIISPKPTPTVNIKIEMTEDIHLNISKVIIPDPGSQIDPPPPTQHEVK